MNWHPERHPAGRVLNWAGVGSLLAAPLPPCPTVLFRSPFRAQHSCQIVGSHSPAACQQAGHNRRECSATRLGSEPDARQQLQWKFPLAPGQRGASGWRPARNKWGQWSSRPTSQRTTNSFPGRNTEKHSLWLVLKSNPASYWTPILPITYSCTISVLKGLKLFNN